MERWETRPEGAGEETVDLSKEEDEREGDCGKVAIGGGEGWGWMRTE